MKKQTSVIGKARLNAATFHNVSFTPSLVNFFFGGNGTGKSTISGELAKKVLRADPDRPDAPIPEILCFGRHYIDTLLREPGNLKGVLSLNTKEEQARDRQRRQVQEDYDQAAEQLRQAQSEYDTLQNVFQAQSKAYKDMCWSMTAPVREKYPKLFAKYKASPEEKERLLNYLLSPHAPGGILGIDNLKAWQELDIAVDRMSQTYEVNMKPMTEQLQSLRQTIETAEARLAQCKAQLKNLEGALPGTLRAMNHINDMLAANGFTGFRLAESGEHPGRYVLIRPGQDENTPAENLSEGERNFIAFLYFYHEVMAPDPDSGEILPKVVIVDDPVSSMDSHVMTVVGSIIRDMLEICLNNARAESLSSQDTYIKQIFILSHNKSFFWDLSTDFADKYAQVNYYLLQKKNNESSLTLCTRRKAPNSTGMANDLPIMDSAVELWIDYQQEAAPLQLLWTIDRILSHEFFWEYGPAEFRHILLEVERDRYVNEDGNFDNDSYQRVTALMTYLYQIRRPIEHVYYSGLDPDADSLRATLRYIFYIMREEQHYDYMMRRAAKFE